jgi:hypothetical protein
MELGVSVSHIVNLPNFVTYYFVMGKVDRNLSKNLKEKDYVQDLEVYERIILEKEESSTPEKYKVQP